MQMPHLQRPIPGPNWRHQGRPRPDFGKPKDESKKPADGGGGGGGLTQKFIDRFNRSKMFYEKDNDVLINYTLKSD